MGVYSRLQNNCVENKRSYPYMGKSRRYGFVVYFTSDSTGYVIHATRINSKFQFELMHYSHDWDESNFESLPKGTIVEFVQD